MCFMHTSKKESLKFFELNFLFSLIIDYQNFFEAEQHNHTVLLPLLT